MPRCAAQTGFPFRGVAVAVAALGVWLGAGTMTVVAQGRTPHVSPGDTVAPKIQRLAGDRRRPGLFAERLAFGRNFRAPPRSEDRELHLTVLKGALYAGRGSRFDLQGVRPLGPESFLLVPRGTPYFWWAPRGTVLQIQGVGPVSTTHLEAPVTAPRSP